MSARGIRKPARVGPKLGSQQNATFKQQMAIGRAIAAQLDEVTPIAEVAANLGLSIWSVRMIECKALYKLAMRMRYLRANELV